MSAHLMLVVDDESLIRMDMSDLAQSVGFRTMEAADAREAIDLIEAHGDVRAVLTDISMPGDMDGMQLAHHVRNRWPPTIIIICSGNARPKDIDLPVNAMFMPKPCTGPAIERLLKSVKAELDDLGLACH